MASGNSLYHWTAWAGKPGDVDFATLDTILTTSADEPDEIVHVMDFDPGATEEYLYYNGFMADAYAGGGVKLTILWTSEATSGDVIWSAAFKGLSDSSNVVTQTFAAENDSAALTTDATARDINESTITFTNGADMASVLKNEKFVIEFHRSSADANDTMNSNDAELQDIYMTEV